jgi:peroxiredoxin
MRNGIALGFVALLLLVGVVAVNAAEKKQAAGTVGSEAPGFALQDQNGKEVKLSDYAGKVVVLEWWNEGCPYVQRHAQEGTMKKLAEKYKDDGVVWLAISSNEGVGNEQNKKAAEKYGLSYPILNDSATSVARSYGAKATPHMFVIDKKGKIAYSGAIDNDPEAEKKDDVNYVAKAVEALLAGETVSVAETKAYGCGVKYAS